MVLKNKRYLVAALLAFVLSAGSVGAGGSANSAGKLFAAKVPALLGRVNDYANVISSHDEQEMNEYLSGLEQTTGAQIVVLTVPSMEGEDIASYAIRVCDEWQIGRKGKDDGALLLLAMQERDLRIEVGYGLEGTLTDAKCGLILRNVVIPEFRNGSYSSGLLKGVKNMCGVVSGNADIVSHRVIEEEEPDDDAAGVLFLVIWLIVFFSILTSRGGLLKWILLNNMMRSGPFGGSSRGRSSSRGGSVYRGGNSFPGGSTFRGGGSFGGGSFHGGGGHFGGGGASAHF